MTLKKTLKKVWHFIWVEDSISSWIVNVILAFLLVKFVIYPLLGLMLGTSYPVVAVVSGSMEHHMLNFDDWWSQHSAWYENAGLSKDTLYNAKFKNGFNKGDIIVLKGLRPEKVKKGDVIVYSTTRYKYPIIHRVVNIINDNNSINFETKGDNNPVKDPETVQSSKMLGKAIFRIPLLGWIKIIFTKIIGG